MANRACPSGLRGSALAMLAMTLNDIIIPKAHNVLRLALFLWHKQKWGASKLRAAQQTVTGWVKPDKEH